MMLITHNFRYASGLLARGVTIKVTPRGSTTVLDTLVTDQQGFLSVDLSPGAYDWWYEAADYRVPFDVAPSTVVPTYVHTQSSPAASWLVEHNRGTRPTVKLFTDDDGDESVYTDVHYIDDNSLIVEWPAPTSGLAYVN
jgi:hypothetical protein